MPKNNSKAMREVRRTQAEDRQKAHEALSVEEKVIKAASRRGKSDREVTRLGVEVGIYPKTIVDQRNKAKHG